MPTAGIACPFCCKAIESAGLAAGARVRCPRCKAGFTLRPEDLRAAALAAPPPAVAVSRPASPAAAPAARSTAPVSAAWLLVLASGGAAVLLLIAATVGVALLLARRTPQVAAAPPSAPPPAAPTAKPAPVDLPRPPDVHRKPLKDEPPSPTPKPPSRNDPPPPDLAPDPPAASRPDDLSPELQDKVKNAIDRGVAFLKKTQDGDGSWADADTLGLRGYRVGLAALVGLTLLNCDVHADVPEVQKAAAFVRKGVPSLNSTTTTYELALAVLFLDRLGDGADESLIQSMALRLIAGQTPTGGWNYQCPSLEPQQERDLLTALRATRPASALDLVATGPTPPGPDKAPPARPETDDAQKALDALPAALRKVPALQPPRKEDAFPATETANPPGTAGPQGADNSNTQFAMLGLWTARRHEVPAERALALVNQRFRLGQREQGGWGYLFGVERKGGVGGTNGWGCDSSRAMTAAGLLGLAVGHGVTADLKGDAAPKEAGEDAAVEKGMKELGQFIGGAGVNASGGEAPDLYFLWSVERVGVLYGRRTIGDKDWYPWGAKILVDEQAENGSWSDPIGPPPVGSSFALLFLKRANVARDLSTKLEFLTEVKPKGPKP